MTVRECYERMGADYEDILRRMGSDERIVRFAQRFLSDHSYVQLCTAMEKADYETAFRAAHTLKGGSMNMSFTRLYEASSNLTDALREGKNEETSELFAAVVETYEQAVSAIRGL